MLAELVDNAVRQPIDPLVAGLTANKPCSREDILALNAIIADFGVFGRVSERSVATS